MVDTDPRADMIRHLSPKFISPSTGQNEPRAALFLNRFTRSLCILYSTEAVTDMLGITPDELKGKSFLECIQEGDVMEATDTIERSKENNSIAYLRFHWRDPRTPVRRRRVMRTVGANTNITRGSDDRSQASRDGGNARSSVTPRADVESTARSRNVLSDAQQVDGEHGAESDAYSAEGDSDEDDEDSEGEDEDDIEEEEEFDDDEDDNGFHARSRPPLLFQNAPVECVISCTSDGLVAVLRRSRIPELEHQINRTVALAPWARRPVLPDPATLGNQQYPTETYMETIRQIATFAWNCTEINGTVRQYAVPNLEYNYADDPGYNPPYQTPTAFSNGEGPANTLSNGDGMARNNGGGIKRKHMS